MPEVMKVLAQGQLGTTTAPMYTVPPANTGVVLHGEWLNTSDTQAVNIDLYVNGSGNANQIKRGVSLAPGESLEFEGKMMLAAGNTFQGKASVATTVTYTIFGAEIS
jgi:hypothetical protein